MAGHWVCRLCDDLGPGNGFIGVQVIALTGENYRNQLVWRELFTERATSFQQFLESVNKKGSEFESCRAGRRPKDYSPPYSEACLRFRFSKPGARAGPLHPLPYSTQAFPPPRRGNAVIWPDLGSLGGTDRTTRPSVRSAGYPDEKLCAIQRRRFHPAFRLIQ